MRGTSGGEGGHGRSLGCRARRVAARHPTRPAGLRAAGLSVPRRRNAPCNVNVYAGRFRANAQGSATSGVSKGGASQWVSLSAVGRRPLVSAPLKSREKEREREREKERRTPSLTHIHTHTHTHPDTQRDAGGREPATAGGRCGCDQHGRRRRAPFGDCQESRRPPHLHRPPARRHRHHHGADFVGEGERERKSEKKRERRWRPRRRAGGPDFVAMGATRDKGRVRVQAQQGQCVGGRRAGGRRAEARKRRDARLTDTRMSRSVSLLFLNTARCLSIAKRTKAERARVVKTLWRCRPVHHSGRQRTGRRGRHRQRSILLLRLPRSPFLLPPPLDFPQRAGPNQSAAACGRVRCRAGAQGGVPMLDAACDDGILPASSSLSLPLSLENWLCLPCDPAVVSLWLLVATASRGSSGPATVAARTRGLFHSKGTCALVLQLLPQCPSHRKLSSRSPSTPHTAPPGVGPLQGLPCRLQGQRPHRAPPRLALWRPLRVLRRNHRAVPRRACLSVCEVH